MCPMLLMLQYHVMALGSDEAILEKMNLRPGKYLLEGCRKINQKRLYLAIYKNTERAKKCRQVIRGKKKSRYEKFIEKEKNPYQTGAF